MMSEKINFTVTIGEMDRHDLEGWDSLVDKFGSGFQKSSLINVFQENWKGVFEPMHISLRQDNKIIAAIPAYLYDSCPRLDYYRSKVSPVFEERILLSQDLLGWYGYPVAENETVSKIAMKEFCKVAEDHNAVAMLSGIDGRDKSLIKSLKDMGFYISLFHTLMVRGVNGNVIDPTSDLPKRKRNRVRNHINNSLKAGISYSEMKREELSIVSELIVRIIREDRVSEEVLPKGVVEGILTDENCKVLVSRNEKNEPIGVKVFLMNGDKAYGWLSGHYRESLKKYRQSHYLYEQGIKMAINEGMSEIQAGRSPYEVKLTHGYKPTPLFCAIKGPQSLEQHEKCIGWVDSLAERHREMFMDTLEQDYWDGISGILEEVSI
jgi:Acetyltransferase (GNAT) domain